MDISKHIENLKEYIKIDKQNIEYTGDFGEFCKNHIEDIEVILERIEYLEENDYAWHQLLKMQNKREYRSKFLKDFQKENGENIMPDYDEIYKRYDKQKRMIEMMAEKLTTPTNGKEWVIKYFEEKVESENE